MTTMTQTMTLPAISDQELLALERQYWDALKDRDTRTVGRMTAEESTVAGASGVAGFGPQAIDKFMANASYKIKDYGIDPQFMRINRICDDVVSIAYGVHEDLEVDGKRIRLDAFDTSVWKKTDNGWACVLHTESLKGDPYGRDRMTVRTSN
jgi:ketosteroid isomerase-like protein